MYLQKEHLIRRTGHKLVTTAMMFAGILPVMAQEETATPVPGPVAVLEAVRVTATRSTMDVEDSPRAISIIEKEQIESHPGISGIQPLLAEIPGISYSRTGGLGGTVIMRGFDSSTRRTALAIDGDRFRGRTALEYNLIDPNSIERIEIIRGPAAVLWGSDAMNGVVNIVTRRSETSLYEPFAMSAHVRALDYNSGSNMYGGRAELVGGGAGFDVLIGAFARDADDYYTPRGRAYNSDFRSRGADFRLGFSPSPDTRFELAGRYQQITTGRAGGTAAPGAPYMIAREDPTQEQYLRFSGETRNAGKMADLLEGSLYIRRFRTDVYQRNATTPAGGLNPNAPNVHIRVYEPTIYGSRINATKGIGTHLLSYGMDFSHEDFGPRYSTSWQASGFSTKPPASAVYTQMERGSRQTNFGLYVSDEWKVSPALVLSGALRGDYFLTTVADESKKPPNENPDVTAAYARQRRITDTPVTGSIGTVLKLSPAWSATAQISRSFRAPSGNELTTTTAVGVMPTLVSPDLKPEHSTTWEAGLRYHAEKLHVNTTAYLSNYRDLILLVDTGIPFGNTSTNWYQRRNIGRARIAGLEVDGQWQFARSWAARFAATWTSAKDKTGNVPLEGVPDIFGRLALRYTAGAGHWYVDAVMRAATRRDRINPATERERAGYAMFDLYAGVDFGKMAGPGARGWKLVAGLENVLNRAVHSQVAGEDVRYGRMVGNPLMEPGRTFVAKLLHDF